MADKDKQHIPKPGLPEAIHPEIGNGAAWAEDAHAFLLRTPDPTVALAGLLMADQIQTTVPVVSAVAFETETVGESTESPIASDNPGIAGQPEQVDITVTVEQVLSESIQEPQEEDREEPVTPKGKKKKKAGKGGNGLKDDPTANLREESEEANPAKAGKLIRKAAKSLQRQEDLIKQEAKPDQDAPEQALSPYTRWLKGLTGSEYVHPYEDDFAFVQGTAPSKEGISETFADLLAAQGYKEQAIEMYMKLMEKYPEKSGFFAAKIEALQQ